MVTRAESTEKRCSERRTSLDNRRPLDTALVPPAASAAGCPEMDAPMIRRGVNDFNRIANGRHCPQIRFFGRPILTVVFWLVVVGLIVGVVEALIY